MTPAPISPCAMGRIASRRTEPAREWRGGLHPLVPLAAAALLAAWPQRIAAQDTPPAGPPPAEDLPTHVARALGEIRDFAFNFDHEGFYHLVDHVRNEAEPPPGQVERVDDWRILLERPSAFRGRWVEVEGVVGRNRGYTIARPGGPSAPLWQLELGGAAEQPIACTVVLTQPADDIPLGARLRVAGRFVMIRQYFDPGNRPRPAALLVGRGPTLVSQAAPPSARRLRANWTWIVAGLTAGLLVAWALLRRATAERPLSDPRGLHASRPAPSNLSQDLARWARQSEGPLAGDAVPSPPPERSDQP